MSRNFFWGKKTCLLLLTCNYVVSVWRGFLFLWVLGMGYVILLWHSLSLPYNYLTKNHKFLEFSKRYSSSVMIYEYINAVRCIHGKRQMTKLETVTISHNFNFWGWWWFLYLCKNNLLKTLTKVIMFFK